MIVLREHECIPVREAWNAECRTVGQKQLNMLLSHQERNGVALFEPRFRSLKASSWVGTVGLGERCLDVIPKIDGANGELDDNQTRRSLLWMAMRAGLIPVADADIARLAGSPCTLLVAFLKLYVEKLSQEWQRGPIRQYVHEEKNRTFLRGKLLFSYQFRHNLIQKHRFYTRTDEFVMDNPLSALLKAALHTCSNQPLSMDVSRDAKRLLLEFDGISDQEFSPADIDNIHVSRQHSRFELLARLAKMILCMTSPGQSGRGEPVYSLMFDMNYVFEKFIAAELQASLLGTGLSVRVQLSGHSLLQKEGKQKFYLRPDIGVFKDNKLVCLMDTKWKRLDPKKSHYGISQADMYQMYAYGKEFDTCHTLILYPRYGELPLTVAEYQHPHHSGEQLKRIKAVTLPVSEANGRMESIMNFRKELLEIVKETEMRVLGRC
jgi:5-methylcytosine-specific restriction enzyme subunit McrC